jgi:hypothetical protein
MHRVLACRVTKKKPRTSRTPHIRQDNRDDTDTQQFIKDITQLRLHASRVAAAVWFACVPCADVVSRGAESVYNRIYLEISIRF